MSGSLVSALGGFARRMGLGKALLYGVHRPLGLARHMMQEGGPLEQRRTARGKREMIAAAGRLPALVAPPGEPLGTVTFLSGRNFWYQTLFCFVSLQRFSDRRIDPVIHDDGTLTPELRAQVARVVPWVRFVDAAAAEAAVDRVLPWSRTPSLRARRKVYPHLRKLTDLHCASTGLTVVMDSDMLFFRRPDALLDFLAAPGKPIYLQEQADAYGYSNGLMEELARGPLVHNVNVGLYALHSPGLDWDYLEACCRTQLEREGPQYLQEQALTALALSGTGARPLPMADYIVLPDLAEGRKPRGVLHHYVAHSKRTYFQDGWKQVVRELAR